jgi:tetratricopeptide (TPR) repeat protein
VFHNPRNPEKVYEIAKTYLREKSYTEANGVYTKLAASAPKAARPLVGMARTHLYEGKHQEAHKFLQLAESRNPNYVHTFSVRGELFMAEGNVEKAIEAYSHGISLSPLNPVRYVQVVEPLMALKRYEEIAEILQKALAAKVEFPLLYHFISQAFFHLKDYKAAIRYIRLAIQADEDNLDYLNQLAISYKESGMLEDAMKTYNKMIKYDPDNLVGLFNKAILLESTNHLDEALKLMERIQQKYPDDVRVQEKLADLRAPKQSA